MKSPKRSFTMSTDRRKKKRSVPRFERIKIIEYGCIGLVILLFVGLAILYGSKNRTADEANADASPSSVPTPDETIRGKNVLDALDAAGFAVNYSDGSYEVISPDGVPFTMRMESDDKGIRELSFETLLCSDPEDETETARLLRKENQRTANEMRKLFDCVMPVFHRSVYDSDTIVKQSQKVVESGDVYSKHFNRYTVRIMSDPEEIPQAVTVFLIRDS